jgi:Pirin C-terminal cupin domain/Fusaric acid resistance protein-like
MSEGDAAKAKSWLGRHRIELRLGLRITVAGVLAFVFSHLLELKQGYWAVLTAVIVVQANVGGSLKAASDRLIGTLAGGAYGVVIVTLVPAQDTIWRGASLVLALLPLAIAAAFRPGLRVAPVTAIIVLLGATTQTGGALPSVIERVVEIAMGSAIAFAVSLFVLPTRAAYIVAGEVEVEGQRLGMGQMPVFAAGGTIPFTALTPATVMLLGGEPLGPRFIEWNFVSSRKERIEQAKADWRAGRMKLPDRDNREFIPLPGDPAPPANAMS